MKSVFKEKLFAAIKTISIDCFLNLQLTTHQWIQAFLVKTLSWFYREVFELNISPIPIFASSFQELLDGQIKFSLRLTQQLTVDKTWFWAIYSTDNKTFFLFKNFEKIFFANYVYSFRYYLLSIIKRNFIISSRNGR